MSSSLQYDSPLGALTVAAAEGKITGLWMQGQKHFGGGWFAPGGGLEPVLERAKEWLDAYFAGEKPDSGTLPLAPPGGAFRQRVWAVLRGIPCGAVAAYGDVAREIGMRPGASGRAIGGAVGRNPVSIIIPCHRVVGAGGRLGGYAGGAERKAALLAHEGVDMRRFTMPGAQR